MLSRFRIRELIRKEFIQLFRDRQTRPLLIMVPFIQLMIFGYVLTTDVHDVRVGLLDQARTRESRLLYDRFDATKTFNITSTPASSRELEEQLLKGDIDLAIKIPPDFSSRIRKGETADVQIIVDGTMSNMASTRMAYASAILEQLNATLLKELHPEEMNYGRIDARIRMWYNPNIESRYYYVPGIVGFMIMLLTLLFTSMAIVRERESGTMEQLIVTPLRPVELIMGKTIPYVIISMVQILMVTLFAIYWFEIPFAGSWVLLFFAACLFLLSTLGVGLVISTLSRTQQQAMMTTFFFILPFFMFSGMVFPIENMPAGLRWLAYVNPMMYFLNIIRGVFLKGVGFHVLWPQFLALAVMGLIVFTGAVKRFRKRLD